MEQINKKIDSEGLPKIFLEREDRHNRSRPPREAYMFFPKEKDIIDIDEKNLNNTRRKVFEMKGENHFIEFEKERLSLFRGELELYNNNTKNEKIELPEGWRESDTLRFLQSTSFDNSKTIFLIKEHLAWKKDYYPVTVNENVEQILNSGWLYIHGRDNHFRPNIVLSAQKYLQLTKKFSFGDFVKAIVYLIEYMLEVVLIPGQVESWNVIGDLSNVSLMTLPSDLMKIFKILQFNYRARLHVVFIIGMSPILNAIWTLMKKLIDPVTSRKIRFLKDSTKDEIFEFINREQLEQKYGGLCPNLDNSSGFFPPVMPSDNFFKEDDIRDEVLLSEGKYRELYFEGKLTVVSPFFSDKIHYRNSFILLLDESISVYEDAKSYQHSIHLNRNTSEVSIYEPCRELTINKSTLNEVHIETEGVFITFEENVEQAEHVEVEEEANGKSKRVINNITNTHSVINFMNSDGKLNFEKKDNFNSNFNTNLYEDHMERVRAVISHSNLTNFSEMQNQNLHLNNIETYNSVRENNDLQYTPNFTLNGNQNENENEIENEIENEAVKELVGKGIAFESDTKLQCCSTRAGKCVIY